jgi:hypothetical protein
VIAAISEHLLTAGGSFVIAARTNATSEHRKVKMILDDMYDSDMSERVEQRQAVLRERVLREPKLDETEDRRVLIVRSRCSCPAAAPRRHETSCVAKMQHLSAWRSVT